MGYNWQWYRVPRYFFREIDGEIYLGPLAKGLLVTLEISALALVLTVVFGLVAAILRQSGSLVGGALVLVPREGQPGVRQIAGGTALVGLALLTKAAVFPLVFVLGAALTMPVHPDLLRAAKAGEPAAVEFILSWGFGRRAQLGGSQVPGLWMLGGGERLLRQPGAAAALGVDLAACAAYGGGVAAAARIACPALVIAGAQDRNDARPAGRPRDPAAPGHLRPDRSAAHRTGDEGVRRRPLARCFPEGGRKAAHLPPLRREMGPPLARHSPLRRLHRQ
jgi:hypothetical protein